MFKTYMSIVDLCCYNAFRYGYTGPKRIKNPLKTHIETPKIQKFSRRRPPNERGNKPPLVLSPSRAFSTRWLLPPDHIWIRGDGPVKGLISNMWLFFYYTIQLITIKLCTKFLSPNSSGCWEIFDRKNVYMYYIREKEGKNENLKKERQNED